MPRSFSTLAAGRNTASGSLSSAPCVSPLGDRRIEVRSAPTSAITRSTASRISRSRFSGEPP